MILNFFFSNIKWLKKNKNNKMFDNLLFQEQFKYLKTTHSYHLVDPSPWPIMAAFGAFMLTMGGVLYMHKFIGGWSLFSTGFCVILYVMYSFIGCPPSKRQLIYNRLLRFYINIL